MADKKKWVPCSLLATATHRFKANTEKGELKFEKGAELELFEERSGWFRGCVVGQDERGLIPSNHIVTRPKPKGEDVGAKQMSLEDIEKMMEVVDDPDDRASVLTKSSGMGRGKVLCCAKTFVRDC